MKNNNYNLIAKDLVSKTIQLHNKKQLEKESLNRFFERNLKENYCNIVIIKYCELLSKNGYEIMRDTEHFDIILYDSIEYEEYIEKICSELPKNYSELNNAAKEITSNIIKTYKSKDYMNKSFDFYKKMFIPKNKYSDKEKSIIEVGIVKYITYNYYDIKSTNPLILCKFD